MRHDGERPKIIVTTDVNGTTTPDNTFGELVRAVSISRLPSMVWLVEKKIFYLS